MYIEKSLKNDNCSVHIQRLGQIWHAAGTVDPTAAPTFDARWVSGEANTLAILPMHKVSPMFIPVLKR